ncbi:glycoside hydrolase family 99-like domain-containing protein [Vibrio breoganii]|uniref:glycosyltransferase WbsX family protein n=1 Tax=Vibrio breoganii TaxID=553239 RepID=UPI000C81C8AA|nr:glycoside hydrolase family 99-like domain-containing protein [Vibrio breoganii]PMG83497.1 hypothetical protein BCU81_15045 [Vibrio breoganii]
MQKLEIYAMYFPQLYTIPENNEWWGDNFTDWKLVKNATPQFEGHHQPRIPEIGYLDQSLSNSISTQVKLANSYLVDGFNFYHYWFDGKVLLDMPMRNLLEDKSLDIKFMITWANENWTRQWVGNPSEILISNSYSDDVELIRQHFDYLVEFFEDERYRKIDNKPILCIYRPEIIKNLKTWMKLFNDWSIEHGFDGISFISHRPYPVMSEDKLYNDFDSIINFQPRYAVNKYLKKKSKLSQAVEPILRRLPESTQAQLSKILKKNSITKYSYEEYIKTLTYSDDYRLGNKDCYQMVFPDWDNTARYNERATLFKDLDEHSFERALTEVIENSNGHENSFIFINAWNEWSEGAYLEPDTNNKLKHLEVIKKIKTING